MYFDLDAFRDLLLLHAVASRISMNRISDSGLLPFSAVKMAAIPEIGGFGLTTMPEGPPGGTMPANPFAPVMHAPTIDLDLSSDDPNLIDFDAAGLTVNLPPTEDKPTKP